MGSLLYVNVKSQSLHGMNIDVLSFSSKLPSSVSSSFSSDPKKHSQGTKKTYISLKAQIILLELKSVKL